MIDKLIALIPDYGLLLLFAVVALAGVAVPLPASMLVLTAGSFAAVGDLSLFPVLLITFLAFALGDQTAFLLASRFGRAALSSLGDSPRIGAMLMRSESMLDRYGVLAVFLSHTLLSPTCAYVSYLSGAGGLSWHRFTPVALIGAAIWTAAYAGLGYIFAAQLEQLATMLSNFFGVVLAGAAATGASFILIARWRASCTSRLPTPANRKNT